MAISKESKQLLSAEILKYNERIIALEGDFKLAKEKRDSAVEKFNKVKAELDNLKDIKAKLKADHDAP